MPNSSDPITDPGRLAALRRTGLLDSPPEEAFDQLARFAAKAMDAPIAGAREIAIFPPVTGG